MAYRLPEKHEGNKHRSYSYRMYDEVVFLFYIYRPECLLQNITICYV